MTCVFLVSSETPDSSESSDPEHTSRSRSKQYKYAAVNMRKRFSGNSLQQQYLQHPFNMKHMTPEMFSAPCKYAMTFNRIEIFIESNITTPLLCMCN